MFQYTSKGLIVSRRDGVFEKAAKRLQHEDFIMCAECPVFLLREESKK